MNQTEYKHLLKPWKVFIIVMTIILLVSGIVLHLILINHSQSSLKGKCPNCDSNDFYVYKDGDFYYDKCNNCEYETPDSI